MKALITGATGFVGRHLLDYLLTQEVEVYACYRPRSQRSEHDVLWVECDITDSYSVRECVRAVQPDIIFHLAAQSFVPMSWRAPTETLTVNALGTLHLLEAVRSEAPEARAHVAGSSEEYGLVYENELPITESNPLRPQSPYAVSKVTTEMLARQYHASYGVKAIVTRAFNHTGPGRTDTFVESDFAKQIARIEAGDGRTVLVGNLSARRDYTDVRDMVRAYWLAATLGEPGEVYNICSGATVSIETVLNMLLDMSTEKDIYVSVDAKRMRPSDVPVLLGNCDKFKNIVRWQPTIPLTQTLEDLLDYWRARVSHRDTVPQSA